MADTIRINPEVAAIPYGDRKRIKTVAEARTDLIDLMSGNPDMEMPTPMPPWMMGTRHTRSPIFNSGNFVIIIIQGPRLI